MTLREKQEALAGEFAQFKTPQERLSHVIQRGRAAPEFPATARTSDNHIEGCLSTLWLSAAIRDGCCSFQADSDSAVVKGLAVLICNLFNGLTPEQVLAADDDLLRQTNLWRELTPNRRSGLARLMDRIRSFARQQLAP